MLFTSLVVLLLGSSAVSNAFNLDFPLGNALDARSDDLDDAKKCSCFTASTTIVNPACPYPTTCTIEACVTLTTTYVPGPHKACPTTTTSTFYSYPCPSAGRSVSCPPLQCSATTTTAERCTVTVMSTPTYTCTKTTTCTPSCTKKAKVTVAPTACGCSAGNEVTVTEIDFPVCTTTCSPGCTTIYKTKTL